MINVIVWKIFHEIYVISWFHCCTFLRPVKGEKSKKPKKFCSNILHHSRQQLIPCCAILHCLSLLKELPSPHELAVPQSKPQESRQISTKLSLKKIYLIIRSSSYLVGFSYGSNRRFLSGSSLENYRVSWIDHVKFGRKW